MDMFTDKLAQKLAAQEIISANSQADAEQMTRLKNQIVEYDECLHKMRGLIEEGTTMLANSRAGSEDVNRLVDEGIAKIRAIQQDTEQLEDFGKRLENRIEKINDGLDDNMHRECVKVYRNVQAVVAEGNEKDLKAIEQMTEVVKANNKKMTLIGIMAGIACLTSVASLVITILTMLHII